MSHHRSSGTRVRPTTRRSSRFGRWGELFLANLRDNDPQQLHELERLGELNRVVQDVAATAAAHYRDTLNALLARETAATDATDRRAQVTRLQRQAEELVCETLVVPNPEWAAQQSAGYTDENTATWSDEPLLPKPTPREQRLG